MRQHAFTNYVTLALLIALVGSAPLAGPFWIGFWSRCVAWMFLAISFTIAYSYARIPSVAQAAIFGVGAYLTVWLAPLASGRIIPLLASGLITGAAASLALGLLIYRMSLNGAAIATIIVTVVAFLLCNAAVPVTGGSNGLLLADLPYSLAGVSVPIDGSMFMLGLGTAILTLLLAGSWLFTRTHTWTVIRAIQQNETRARVLGYSVDLYRLGVFTVSGACAGLGGSLYALVSRQVTSDMVSLGMSLKAILWAVVGGVSSLFGAPLGVAVVQLAAELLLRWTLRVDAIIGLLLIATALLLPKGVVGLLETIGSRLSILRHPAGTRPAVLRRVALSIRHVKPKPRRSK